ncbi:MAG: hypothetical protein NZ908_02185 [Candidatus Micrarchaeota archaeon]|nr:hypothetical protein [Candidatus Micrarchaeota archaeon]MCX8154449.1 hypothetical protein [Candidatus Micrarchaeota archaeon]
MVLRNVFSIIIVFITINYSTCSIQPLTNDLLSMAYSFVGLILLGLVIFTMYSYAVADQQKKIILRTQVINYLFGVLILIAVPSFTAFLCNIQMFLFSDSFSNQNYLNASLNILQKYMDETLSKTFDNYQTIAMREGQSNTPYSFMFLSFQLTGTTILYLIMSKDQPNLITTAIHRSLRPVVVTYLPYKQYMVYNSITDRISRDMEMVYVGLNMHIFILNIINSGLFAGLVIVGVVGRLIPGLRKAGDMLIAFGLGMHILYPFLYSIYLQSFDEIFNHDRNLYNQEYVKNVFVNAYSYYQISIYQLMIITLPNLALASVAAFTMNAYKTFDFIESM